MRTCAFNKAHRRLRRRVAGSRLLRVVYDVGSVSGVAGMVFGYYVIYSTLFASASSPLPGKRTVSVHPIIPGITTPLSHLPVILFCLLLCQVIHELGHAVAAAVENIPLLHAGLSLSSAFVALPPLAPRCSPRAQLRIIAAGPFHNLLTFLLLAALPSLAPLLPSTDLSPHGALVLAVAPHSVLRPYLPTGTIITHLDDYPLFNASVPDPWSSYLLAPQSASLSPYDSPPDTLPHQGWCLPSPQFLHAPSSCCDRSPDPNSPPDPSSHLACFDALPPSTHPSRCIDPVPILSQPPLPPYPSLSPQPHPQPQTPYTRCASPRDCAGLQDTAETDTDAEAYICALPRPAEHLLRITILAPNTSTQLEGQEEDTMRLQTLLWTGPRREIYDQVHTTQHLPFPYPTLPTKQTNSNSMHNQMLRTYTLLAPGARLLYTYVPPFPPSFPLPNLPIP
ncbi:Membrane-bound transcription factor site-2 protease, partial [Pleurotus pulmonarius]